MAAVFAFFFSIVGSVVVGMIALLVFTDLTLPLSTGVHFSVYVVPPMAGLAAAFCLMATGTGLVAFSRLRTGQEPRALQQAKIAVLVGSCLLAVILVAVLVLTR